ncbi:unnamed protein product [Sphagnum balticum]
MMRSVIERRWGTNNVQGSIALVHRIFQQVVLLDTAHAHISGTVLSAVMERAPTAATTHQVPCSPSIFFKWPRSSSTWNLCASSARGISTDHHGKYQVEDKYKAEAKVDHEEGSSDESREAFRADLGKVKELPRTPKQQWWKPDPETGFWVPDEYQGHVTSKSPATLPKARIRSETTSIEDRRWWSSMEELPDMDRTISRPSKRPTTTTITTTLEPLEKQGSEGDAERSDGSNHEAKAPMKEH